MPLTVGKVADQNEMLPPRPPLPERLPLLLLPPSPPFAEARVPSFALPAFFMVPPFPAVAGAVATVVVSAPAAVGFKR